jgi:VIT1/CCC1 family predicted Fe2+/Mn2+ transporter
LRGGRTDCEAGGPTLCRWRAAWRIPLTVLAVVAALCATATAVARLGGLRVGRTVLIGVLTMLLTLAGGLLFDL